MSDFPALGRRGI